MGTTMRIFTALGFLIWLMCGSFVDSIFDLPCLSQLGLSYSGSDPTLFFDLDVSSGKAEDVRLNAPKAWAPLNISGSFIEINMSEPVLLTGLLAQGDPHSAGLITGWLLDTSFDCENYNTENYSIDTTNPVETHIVPVKHMEFVSCIRLRPTHYKGKTPALRLELLGCIINDNKCGRDVSPTTEIWMDNEVRQLNFDHDIVLAWVKVVLELHTPLDMGNVDILYSRSCDEWLEYESTGMNIISVMSTDRKSRCITIEMDAPVRARCLRIFPPPSTTLREVHTSGCNLHLKASLQEMKFNAKTGPSNRDAGAQDTLCYHRDSPTTSDETQAQITEENVDARETDEEKSALTNSTEKSTSKTIDNNIPNNPFSASPKNEPRISDAEMISVTTETSPIVEATETLVSNKNASTENFSNSPTASYSSNSSDGEKSVSGHEDSPSLNYTDITNSSISHNTTLEHVTLPSEKNDSSIESERAVSNTEDQTKIINISNIKSISDTDSTNRNSVLLFNITHTDDNSLQDTGAKRVVNTSDDEVSELNVTSHQSNTSSWSENLGLSPLIVNNTETKNKDYNQTDCGIKQSAEGLRIRRVTSGTVNYPGQWPWLVSMHYLKEFEFTIRSGFKHTCGASLIAPNWILTAAHCFADDLLQGLSNVSNWRIYFGMHDLARTDSSQDFVQERLIQTIYVYPRYNILNDPLIYDLAVVKLNESVGITEKVSPVCLDDTDLHYQESLCYISGWGQPSIISPGSRYPYTAALTTITLSTCKDMYDKLPENSEIRKYVRIEPPVLCAAVGENGEDACKGDSGGPLMCEHDGRWYQAGIIAGGHECGHKETPGLYSRTSFYIDWIMDIMKRYGD